MKTGLQLSPLITYSLAAWNDEDIQDDELASWVNGLQAGQAVFAFSECFGGGMADDLTLKEGWFAAWAADYYETSNYGRHTDWADVWVKGLEQQGLRSTYSLGQYALENDDYGPYKTWGTTLSTLPSIYYFTFTFSEGDCYTGKVYTRQVEHPSYEGSDFVFNEKGTQEYTSSGSLSTDTLYYLGQSEEVAAEDGQTGTYQITGCDYIESEFILGLVYVDTYYDAESGNTYTPVSNGSAVGTNYLKSEHDYIIQDGVSEYYFGGGYYEADLTAYAYTFTFTYGDGDYYKGTVYAAPEYGYYTGYTQTVTDENGQTGTYTITGVTPGFDVSLAGEVYVTSYYDYESGKPYTPVGIGTAVGIDYLWSESDYIIQSGITDYLFGNSGGTFYEADLVSYAYNFTFSYSGLDSYTGTVYAEPEYGYYLTSTLTTNAEGGQTGTYMITGVSTGFDVSLAGEVYVTSYYDYESGRTYTPVSNGTAVGTSYLGSEHDYIIKSGVPEYLFGKSGATFYEADLVSYAYSYKLTYGDGDYYTGTVYAAPEYGYFNGYTKTTTDENGQSGTYTINQVTTGFGVSLAGQVFVTSYSDKESGKSYTPLGSTGSLGSSYLASESGYLIKSGVTDFYFGGGYYEADLGGLYTFTFNYGTTGIPIPVRSMRARVLRHDGLTYAVNNTKTLTDEQGAQGTYKLTGIEYVEDVSQAGQVLVTSYSDKESGKTFTPVSNGTAIGTEYLGSEVDYIIEKDIPEFEFGKDTDGIFYEADVGDYSHYDFTFSYNNGSGDYYTGYVYAPTSFETYGCITVGTLLQYEPEPMGGASLGGYYYITAITDGYASSYDKKSYITAYYDADTAKASLGVNSDGSATAANIYVASRTAAYETGYAISGTNHGAFSPYTEADVNSGGAMADLGLLGGSESYARGINDSGQIVGDSATSSNHLHAFLYANGAMTDLGTWADISYALGINDSGQIVGDSATSS